MEAGCARTASFVWRKEEGGAGRLRLVLVHDRGGNILGCRFRSIFCAGPPPPLPQLDFLLFRSISLLPASLSGVLHGCSTAHPRLLRHPSTSLLNATTLHRTPTRPPSNVAHQLPRHSGRCFSGGYRSMVASYRTTVDPGLALTASRVLSSRERCYRAAERCYHTAIAGN
ncbi:hypothetical protein KSP40_PGU002417 [Platanthera guangdongensis]|uniref:Uncharacterized protein n=1 Tax=Platanthera guangdongensis TaxID=2320717 RepID=A0ABR2LGR6_9ASPA